MSKYKAVIFDLDGTLLNTIDDLAAGVNHVLAAHGYPVHSVPEVQSMVGNGVARLMALAVPEGTSAEEQSAMLAEFREYYFRHSEVYTKPYDGIEELLAGLQSRGIKTAVTSNKFDAAVKKLCDKYFGSLITVAIGESADTPKKPDPKMVEKALARAMHGKCVRHGAEQKSVVLPLPVILAIPRVRTYHTKKPSRFVHALSARPHNKVGGD